MKDDTTYYRFLSEVRFFLSKLLKNPITANVSDYLKERNFTKNNLIRVLLKRDVIERHEKVLTPEKSDKNIVEYKVYYKVKRKDFERKIKKIYIQYFEKNVPEKGDINETSCGACMGGATTTGSVGADTTLGYIGYSAPFGNIQRRNILQNKKKKKHNANPTKILGKTITAESTKLNESKDTIIAYHGSHLNINELTDDRFTYFTDDKEYALHYAENENSVYKAEITLNKPLYIDNLDSSIFDEESNEEAETWEELDYSEAFLALCNQIKVNPKVFEESNIFTDIEYNCLWEIVNNFTFINIIKKHGVDSIITKENDKNVFIVFSKNQIKWIDKKQINECKKIKKIHITEGQLKYIKRLKKNDA